MSHPKGVFSSLWDGALAALGLVPRGQGAPSDQVNLGPSDFDAQFYLTAYPDVAAAGVDPLEHFLRHGLKEGRLPRLPSSQSAEPPQLPPAVRLQAALDTLASVAVEPPAALARAIGRASHNLHLTFGHDDYTATYGGSQLCLRLESSACARRGIDHLHIHPARPCHFLREVGEPGPLRVLLNGHAVGIFSAEAIADVLRQAASGGDLRATLAIHSTLGHSPDDIVAMARAIGLTEGVFWLHDFASLCAGFQLLRDDQADCGAPPPGDRVCAACSYGSLRARHLDGHRRLFAQLALTVASPSQNALDFWRAAGGPPAAAHVVAPHAELEGWRDARSKDRSGPLRVAYLGMPIDYKGWATFERLVLMFEGDDRYEFLHLGAYPAASACAFHEVVATGAAPDLMRQTLEALSVDVALVWPLCRETFSFVAYEAVAAGACVVTHAGSGNVADFVQRREAGIVFDGEAALVEAFSSGDVLTLKRGARSVSLHELRYSDMSLGLAKT